MCFVCAASITKKVVSILRSNLAFRDILSNEHITLIIQTHWHPTIYMNTLEQ